MSTRLVSLASLIVLVGVAAPASVVRAQDDVPVEEEDAPVDDDEEPPPPDEPLTLEATLRLVGEGREEEGLALLRAGARDASVATARGLLATATDPLLLIGAAEWVAEVERSRPPPPGKAPPDLARPVRERLGRPGPTPEGALLEAQGALGIAGDLTPLDGRLRDASDEAIAAAAARGLCRSRDPQGLAILLVALTTVTAQLEEPVLPDADPDVVAARAAIEARHTTLLDALRWAARTARAQRLVEAAAMEPHLGLLEALREVRPRPARLQARELALMLLEHHDARVRAGATLLLAGCAAVLNEEDRERLLAALGDPEPVVRVAAARSVYPLALRRAAPRLIELLDDADAEVRRAAHETLKLIARQPFPARRALWEAWWAKQPPERQAPN